MTYRPQRIVAPDGTEMVVIRASDYDQLVAAAALDEDIRHADRVLGRDDARYPTSVVDAILAGASPLRAWREYRGFSQVALAQRAGITATALNKIEAGKREGRALTRRAIARALDVPISALDPLDD
jgi:DNA-binding XRE family transcriptional regulator